MPRDSSPDNSRVIAGVTVVVAFFLLLIAFIILAFSLYLRHYKVGLFYSNINATSDTDTL